MDKKEESKTEAEQSVIKGGCGNGRWILVQNLLLSFSGT